MHWLLHVQSVIATQHCYQNAVVSFCRKSSPKNLLLPWFNTEMPEEIRLFTGRWSWKDTKAYCMPAVMTSHLAHTTEHKDNSEDELLLESPGKSNKKHLKRLATLAQNKHFFLCRFTHYYIVNICLISPETLNECLANWKIGKLLLCSCLWVYVNFLPNCRYCEGTSWLGMKSQSSYRKSRFYFI